MIRIPGAQLVVDLLDLAGEALGALTHGLVGALHLTDGRSGRGPGTGTTTSRPRAASSAAGGGAGRLGPPGRVLVPR